MNPSFADAYAQLAWVVGRQLDRTKDAAELMIKALKLSPGREDYLFGLGTLLSNAEDFDAAKLILVPLAARSVDESVRKLAQERLTQIVAYEKQRAPITRKFGVCSRSHPLRDWTLAAAGATASSVIPRQRAATVRRMGAKAHGEWAHGEGRIRVGMLARASVQRVVASRR